MKQFRDRVAVVTGAGSGIGRAVSLALAHKGCHLALVDLNEVELAETADLVRALPAKVSTHAVDVSDRERMRALPAAVLAEHGAVHILINNAGVDVDGLFDAVSVEDLEWLLGINLMGVLYGCKFFLPHLKAAEEAHIVNISSLFGLVGMPEHAAYSAAKFAVRGFSEALWTEVIDDHVGVTSVHPGGVKTNIVRRSRATSSEVHQDRIERFDKIARMSPEGAAEQIVGAIEKNRLRIRICRETYLVDWLKRLFPVATQRLLLRLYRPGRAR